MSTTESSDTMYTVTEAARLARVSVQALRQRIQRGTLNTTRMVRDRRIVAGVQRDELIRAYPELSEAAVEDLERVLHGEDPGERERVNELEQSSTKLETERDKARRSIMVLRKRLLGEREVRARLEGVVEDQERRLEELGEEKSRLEGRVRELDNRMIFLDGGEDELPQPIAWWNNPVIWIRTAVIAVVLFTFNAAGAAYWGNLDKRLDAHFSEFRSSMDVDGSVAPDAATSADSKAEKDSTSTKTDTGKANKPGD
ncbi:MAG: hypothetical protein ACI8TQ_001599 [Planctomycetota bacterium]|jgi:hypothetical protein